MSVPDRANTTRHQLLHLVAQRQAENDRQPPPDGSRPSLRVVVGEAP